MSQRLITGGRDRYRNIKARRRLSDHITIGCIALVGGALAIVACDSNSGSPPNGGAAGQAGTSDTSGAGGMTPNGAATIKPIGTNRYLVTGVSNILGSSTGGTAGSSASGSSIAGTAGAPSIPDNSLKCVPIAPPGTPPAIAVCGDGFRTGAEACDDGNLAVGDACSATCEVTPRLVAPHPASTSPLPLPVRELSVGRHPLAAGCNTVGVGYLDHASEPGTLNLATFSNTGSSKAVIPFGVTSIGTGDASIVALPDDTFIAAWTGFDGDGDELGIQLRKLDPTLSDQSDAIVANASTAFSQHAPDIVFDGSKIVVAWVDESDASTAPDLRYRTFTPDLKPLTNDTVLSATAAVEGHVALAAREGIWAAAWRSGNVGMETIEVQSGTAHWSVGPFLPAVPGDLPALAFLDSTHLAMAFTEGTDPTQSGTANVPRLHAALLDTAAPGVAPSFEIAPLTAPYSVTPSASQTQPVITAFSDRLLVGWRSSAIAGDALGDELWVREVRWTQAAGNALIVDTSSPERRMLGLSQSGGDQSSLALLSSNLWPEQRLLSAWQDSGKTFASASGVTDVALQITSLQAPQPSLRTFPLSADGKYYNVNVLRRSPEFPAPTASVSAIGPSSPFIFPPYSAFDGDDSPVAFISTTVYPYVADPAAGQVLTIDLGRVVSLAAASQQYPGTYTAPDTTRLRLAETPGNWIDVVPTEAIVRTGALDLNIFHEFPPTPARYIELTQIGVPPAGIVEMYELSLYPSAPANPPPSTADGYDLTQMTGLSAVADSNLYFGNGVGGPGSGLFDKDFFSWFAGKTPAMGGTADGSIVLDLGDWFVISEIDTPFYAGANWQGGGMIEIAADPSSWVKVYDSGRGHQFGPGGFGAQAAYFSKQIARYIRITDYFIPGMGLSPDSIEEVEVF
jgi:cysteine-rich repeat protein